MGTSPDELKQDIEETRAELAHNVDTLAEKVSPTAVAGRRVDDARNAVSGIKDKVMGSAHGASGQLSDTASSVGDSISSAPGAVKTKATGNPLAAGVIAFGVGLLVSSLLPSSDREQQAAVALKEKAEPLTNQAKEEAKAQTQQLREALTPAAQEAASQVKSTATDAAQQTKEQATSAVGEVTGHARDAVSETRSDVADHAAQAREEAGSSDSPYTSSY